METSICRSGYRAVIFLSFFSSSHLTTEKLFVGGNEKNVTCLLCQNPTGCTSSWKWSINTGKTMERSLMLKDNIREEKLRLEKRCFYMVSIFFRGNNRAAYPLLLKDRAL